MYVNKVQIIGNITSNLELKALPTGTKVCSFSVATNESYKDGTGKKIEKVEYHNVVSFGKSAEILAQYMVKGSQIYIEGKLQTRTWEKDGQKHYRTEILVISFQFGNKPRESDQSYSKPTNNESDEIEYPTDDYPEDIPF